MMTHRQAARAILRQPRISAAELTGAQWIYSGIISAPRHVQDAEFVEAVNRIERGRLS